MKRLLTVVTLLFVVFTISLSGCLGKEPIIPDDIAEKIKTNLGYALAPTWLPEEYEYAGPFLNTITADRAFPGETMLQSYGNYASAGIEDSLVMSYPYPTLDTIPSAFLEITGLIPPEDAITKIEINRNTAYLYQGSWSDETRQRVAKLEEPIDPEWDYERSMSIRFTIDVPDEGSIWVSISTIFSVEDITQKDLVKIARSVIAIE
jgi:hypothetical protein